MNLVSSLLQSGLTDNLLQSMSSKTGMAPDSVKKAVSTIAPVMLQKANENFKGAGNSNALLQLIGKMDLDRLGQEPDSTLNVQDGNALLGEILGSKDASRSLASRVGSELGIDAGQIKKLLPLIAPVVAGLLNKKTRTASRGKGDSASMLSSLSSLIDKDGDGSVADDVLGLAGRFFK